MNLTFDFPTYWSQHSATFLKVTLQFLLLCLFFWIGKRSIRIILGTHFDHFLATSNRATSPQRRETLRKLIKNALTYTLYFFFFYNILALFGFPVSTLLAGAGIASVALGMGAKEFVTDTINGFFIVSEGQFDIGDQVELPNKGISGTVRQIGIRTTIIQGYGNHYVVPNREISLVNNLSRIPSVLKIKIPLQSLSSIDKHIQQIDLVTSLLSEAIGPDLISPVTSLGIRPNPDGSFYYQIDYLISANKKTEWEGKIYQAYLSQLSDLSLDPSK